MADQPSFNPGPYSASNAEDLNNFYTPRIRGEKTGYAPEDINAMESRAVNNANYSVDEAVRRGANARRAPGGVYTGGMSTTKESAVNSALAVRSGALQDIAVQNAILKHQDQWNAAAGLQNFMSEQDQVGLQRYGIESQMYNNQVAMDAYMNMYQQQASATKNSAMWGSIGQIAGAAGTAYSGYQTGQGDKALAAAYSGQ